MGNLDHQPDKGGIRGNARSATHLPTAQPAAKPSSNESSASSPITTSDTNPYKAAREALDRDGFVVLSASLFPSFDLDTLRAAASGITAAARSGQWPYIRTLPKQFPPWPQDASNGIWGVQHLLHPTNPEHITFAKTYFDSELLKYVSVLIGCCEDDLTMELYNMLVRPERDFSLRWHRDDMPATATAEEEEERLKKPAHHAQWNLALYDDSSLVLIPGSHVRARTDVERAADPYEAHMPGQITVKLKAGEVAFYNNNILHRGVYDSTKERMTLHGSIGTTQAGIQRARNVLQHGVGVWAKQLSFDDFEPEMAERAKMMRERLDEMGNMSGDVGYFAETE
ncbi:hypothetical protein BDW02DRAFT_399152 [Decorospora gaudefroyi]|uniref:Phytanoyl-CoA dioxygenase family protein n=1 Tax=Decorospora gaudefroyi TaxID=184978 RepID=A0A6A5KF59_9PLEO|nr:hypothetical protein BDW02DRAFT_399152 [Decorospora gaudefroyi]